MPALARRKTLPQSNVLYSDVTDPLTRDLIAAREILNDVPDDGSPARSSAEVGLVEAILRYARFDVGDAGDTTRWDDADARLSTLAQRVPVRHRNQPQVGVGAAFDALKGRALRKTALELDRPVRRAELNSSRTMYHAAPGGPDPADVRPIRPIVDLDPASLRSRIQGGMYRLLAEVLTKDEPESKVAGRKGFALESLNNADGTYRDFDEYVADQTVRGLTEPDPEPDGWSHQGSAARIRGLRYPQSRSALRRIDEIIRQAEAQVRPTRDEMVEEAARKALRPVRRRADVVQLSWQFGKHEIGGRTHTESIESAYINLRPSYRPGKTKVYVPEGDTAALMLAPVGRDLPSEISFADASVGALMAIASPDDLALLEVGPDAWTAAHVKKSLALGARAAAAFPWIKRLSERPDQWWKRTTWPLTPVAHPGCDLCGGCGYLVTSYVRLAKGQERPGYCAPCPNSSPSGHPALEGESDEAIPERDRRSVA